MVDLIGGLVLMAGTAVILYVRGRARGHHWLPVLVWSLIGGVVAPLVWLGWLTSWWSKRHRTP